MINLVISFIWFITTVFLHIALHRLLENRGVSNFKTILLFPLGFIVNILFLFNIQNTTTVNRNFWNLPLPINASILYGLLSWFYIIYFASSYFGEISPSARIILLLQEKGTLPADIIKAQFTDHELVEKRLEDLINGQFIDKKNGRYVIASKAKLMVKIIDIYRWMLGGDSGG